MRNFFKVRCCRAECMVSSLTRSTIKFKLYEFHSYKLFLVKKKIQIKRIWNSRYFPISSHRRLLLEFINKSKNNFKKRIYIKRVFFLFCGCPWMSNKRNSLNRDLMHPLIGCISRITDCQRLYLEQEFSDCFITGTCFRPSTITSSIMKENQTGTE